MSFAKLTVPQPSPLTLASVGLYFILEGGTVPRAGCLETLALTAHAPSQSLKCRLEKAVYL